MMILATIGPTGLYLLFIWLLSSAIGSWLSERKGYGEKLGLTFGLLLSAIGLLIVLILPGRPGSKWKVDGPIPKRGGQQLVAATGSGPQDLTVAAGVHDRDLAAGTGVGSGEPDPAAGAGAGPGEPDPAAGAGVDEHDPAAGTDPGEREDGPPPA